MNVSDIEDYLSKLKIVESGFNINNTTVGEYFYWDAPDLGYIVVTIQSTGLVNSYCNINEVEIKEDGTETMFPMYLGVGGGSSGTMVRRDRMLVQKNHKYKIFRSASNVVVEYYKLGI